MRKLFEIFKVEFVAHQCLANGKIDSMKFSAYGVVTVKMVSKFFPMCFTIKIHTIWPNVQYYYIQVYIVCVQKQPRRSKHLRDNHRVRRMSESIKIRKIEKLYKCYVSFNILHCIANQGFLRPMNKYFLHKRIDYHKPHRSLKEISVKFLSCQINKSPEGTFRRWQKGFE